MHTDPALIDQVLTGDEGAFEELHRRHGSSMWRLAQAAASSSSAAAAAVADGYVRVVQALRAGRLQRGGDLRAYLLTGTRNAAVDAARTDASPAAATTLPAGALERSFRDLPERWRSILWLTEVEELAPKDAALLLGLSTSAASQLAVRARAGLRERLLQAHLRTTGDGPCRTTLDRLGAHVSGGLAPRDVAKVDQHLAACATCREHRAELDGLGTSLSRFALAVPAGLGATSAAAVRAAVGAPTAPALRAVAGGAVGTGAVSRAMGLTRTPWFQKAVAASSAAVLAVGVASIGFHDVEDAIGEIALGPTAPAEVALPAPVSIDLAGQVAPLALSTEAVGGAVARVGSGPARPTVAAADRGLVAAPTPSAPAAAPGSPAAPGAVAASPTGPAPAAPAAPTGPLSETPAGQVPVPPAPAPVPVPPPAGGIVDTVVDSVASTITTVQESSPAAAPEAPAPTQPVVEVVVEAVPEPVSEPLAPVTDSLGL